MTRTPKDAKPAPVTDGWHESTDQSFTPPHGDPERSHLDSEDDSGNSQSDTDEEGPGLAEGHTDNKAGG